MPQNVIRAQSNALSGVVSRLGCGLGSRLALPIVDALGSGLVGSGMGSEVMVRRLGGENPHWSMHLFQQINDGAA